MCCWIGFLWAWRYLTGAGVILWRWSWLRLTYRREVRVMSERDSKETLMSGCAGCGEAMDFDPDDPRPEFEFQCEHCQKVNIVIWGVGEPPHWYTEIKPNSHDADASAQ